MVYFIANPRIKTIKIGYSIDPLKRLSGLQTGTPDRLELLGAVPGGIEEEHKWHEQFSDDRVGGEWFHDSMDLRKAIEQASKAWNPDPEEAIETVPIPSKPEGMEDIEIIMSIDANTKYCWSWIFSNDACRRRLETFVLVRNMKAWGVYPFPAFLKSRQDKFDKRMEKIRKICVTSVTR